MAIKYFILVGIGGSNLGAKAVYEALHKEGQPVMLFADTVSPVMLERIIAKLKTVKKEEVLLNYVSKSGKTLESPENFEALKEYSGTIVDTYKDLEFDKTIGGRFSVLTEVGLFPLRTCGFDTDELLRGKADASEGNAEWLFGQLQDGMVVHDMFLFGPELESLGKWYRQLMNESTGKDGKGFLATVSVGSTDLHSSFQRYIGGPRNIATTFVCAGEPDKFYKATIAAYKEHGLPFQEYLMPELNEYELGKFFETKMREIVHLAHLMGVDPYDQPNVEAYKRLISG
ncbi:MAG: hypothetical protein AAB420_02655 [Patescibacteria group bacterium]